MSSEPSGPVHPGRFVKEHYLPKGLSVTDAAKTLGVGRPALSNFLNGKAALSPEMAMRLEKAFGADRQKLLDLQAKYDAHLNSAEDQAASVRSYVPALMRIKARQIAAWADKNINARSEFAALLRILVHSTAGDLKTVDFPAYDNAERHGWDGKVESSTATPWIPAGTSAWEFGCNEDPQAKANKDFAARVKSVPDDERRDTHFVFVTPRNWPEKTVWVKKKTELGKWKSVRAYDADDLEQWSEQSIPGQIWLAEKIGLPVTGYRTLGTCWRDWSQASEPPLPTQMFDAAIESFKETFGQWLSAPPSRPFIVAADSVEEALAFLACILGESGALAAKAKDLPLVFDTPEALKALTGATAPFIPIVYAAATEKELACHFRSAHCIVVRPRNAVDADPDIRLDLLAHEDFIKSLEVMGIKDNDAEQLAKASAHSPTILRRLRSPIGAIRTPHWASDHGMARDLVPVALLGAWHAGSNADCEVVSLLADAPFKTVEERISRYQKLNDSPVWMSGQYRGVTSKIDTLFAVAGSILESDINEFLFVAEHVLSERDPALDLPEGDRWAAGIYGKVRDHSSALRTAICETLVLLAVHGNQLLQKRLGIDMQLKVTLLIRRLLGEPLSLETLLTHDRDLPSYAEAAPEEFLRIIENDLRSNAPACFDLMKPVDSSFFGAGCPRTGLLWALESLAWNKSYLPRVVKILGALATRPIDDNWSNKPEGSLQSIFRSWMPQTAAPLEERISALEMLAKSYPRVGWDIITKQFETYSQIGHYSYRPRWRNDASGVGQPLQGARAAERRLFVRRAIELAIDWPSHDENTLGDLVERLEAVLPEHREAIWDAIGKWAKASDDQRARSSLQERIRRFAFTKRGQRRGLESETKDKAREAFDALMPSDLVVRHGWLFADSWIEMSVDELEDTATDFLTREARIRDERLAALREIWSAQDFDGMTRLLASSAAPHIIGNLMAQIIPVAKAAAFVGACLAAATGDLKSKLEECLRGYLLGLGQNDLVAAVTRAAKALDETGKIQLYLCLPFRATSWRLFDAENKVIRDRYWANVRPYWEQFTATETNELIDNLLDAGRPGAAFQAVHMSWNVVETSRLKRLLTAVATTSGESPAPYKIQSFEISTALTELERRAGITTDDMGHLEFLYIEALDHSEHGIRNLEKQIAASPNLFVQAVVLSFRRNDGKTDPPEFVIEDERRRSAIASATYKLLHQVSRVPGTRDDGTIDVNALNNWIAEVRTACERMGRAKIADQMIGELLSKDKPDQSGYWPSEAVSEAMEAISSPDLGTGFSIGTRNQRGCYWVAEDGSNERELAERYRGYAKKIAFDYPFVSGILEQIASSYDREAEMQITEHNVRRRIPY